MTAQELSEIIQAKPVETRSPHDFSVLGDAYESEGDLVRASWARDWAHKTAVAQARRALHLNDMNFASWEDVQRHRDEVRALRERRSHTITVSYPPTIDTPPYDPPIPFASSDTIVLGSICIT